MRKFFMINLTFILAFYHYIVFPQTHETYMGYGKLEHKTLLQLGPKLDLFLDSTFISRTTYDLVWSEFGKYNFEKDTLILYFYPLLYIDSTANLKDKLDKINKVCHIEKYLRIDNKLFLLNINGRVVKNTKTSFYYRKKFFFIKSSKYKYWLTKIE